MNDTAPKWDATSAPIKDVVQVLAEFMGIGGGWADSYGCYLCNATPIFDA
jgi:hypothetical protein